MIWLAVLGGAAACYLFKLVGLAVPQKALDNERVRRVAALMPVALLAALIAIQTFTVGNALVLDPRAAGLGAAAVAVLLRSPFLVVVAVACATAAVVRLLVV
jgi:branched-subunit amino acid transport protein